MIENFEELTYELDQYEMERLPKIVKFLSKRVGKDKAVTASYIISQFRSGGYKMDGPRWRKIVQYIRINGLVSNLISTSKGYYVSNDPHERESYLNSLRQRIQSMTMTYDAMEYQHRNS